MTQIITSRGGGNGGGGGGGDGDMKKSVYDPQNIGKDAFDYENFTNTPTIPTEVSELDNDAGYITSSALSGYQTTSNLVTNLTNPDDTHYPSAKAVSDAITSAGGGDMMKSVYDPNNIEADAFDYNNFINTPTIPAESNTKTFTLSSTSDLVTAQAAYDWYRSGNNPIILYSNNAYILSGVASSFVYFVANNEIWGTMGSSRSTVSISTVTFQKDGNTIEAINTTAKYAFNFIETDRNYSTAYTPQYNGSPATKKYVDDTAGGKVSDAVYGSGWDGVTGVAPSKNAVYDKINSIDGLIPSAATSSNQLADKTYVNDSINSVTAYYITKNAAGDQFANYAELAAATTFYSGGVVRVPTRNDYTIVLDDENHDHATTRYIYNSSWEYQYTVNETALTQAQLDALNSGITAGKVSTYDGYASTISGKQDALTLPATPTQGHIVTWGADNETLADGGAVPTSSTVNQFAYPSVNDDITTLHNWLFQGSTPTRRGAVLTTGGGNYTTYYTLTYATRDTFSDVGTIYAETTDNTGTTYVKIDYSMPSSTATVTAITTSNGSFFAPSNAGSTGNVLTKTASGYEWAAASGGDAKVFTITGTTGSANLTAATNAYTWAYTDGKPAFIYYSKYLFAYVGGTTSAAYFSNVYGNGAVSSGTWARIRTLKLTVSSGSVTAIADNYNYINVSSSAPSSSTTNNTITLVI